MHIYNVADEIVGQATQGAGGGGGGIGGMCPHQIILKIESPLFSQWFILALLLYSSIANPQTMSFFIDVDGSRVTLF